MRFKMALHRGWYFLLMVSPILPNKLGLFFIYAAILGLILSKKFFGPRNPLGVNQERVLWLAIAFFLFYALSLLWGGAFATGIKSVEIKLLFLVLPSLFLLFGRRSQDVGDAIYIFIIVVNLALVTCLAIALYQASIYVGFQDWPFKYYNFTYWIGAHPGYLSLLVLLSLVSTGFILKNKKGKGKVWWASLIFQTFMLFFIGAKYAVFSFLISTTIFLLLFKLRRKQILIGAMIFLSLCSGAFMISVNSWNRISTAKQALSNRMELNKAGLDLFTEKWAFGYGAGNVDDKLKNKYKKLHLDEAFSNNYNIHNQYLQTLLSVGVVGFALLISVIVLVLVAADNRVFAFLVLLQFMIFFVIESALVRQQGVVPFVTWLLFISLYTYREQFGLSRKTA